MIAYRYNHITTDIRCLLAPTGWAGGWMGRQDAPPDAVVVVVAMPRPELNRPTGVLIQGVPGTRVSI